MATHPPIDPGPGHVTVFGSDGQETVFQTYRQTDMTEKPSNDATAPPGDNASQTGRLRRKRPTDEYSPDVWTISVPSERALGEHTGDVGELPWPWPGSWPGRAAPGQFTVHRSFDSLEHVRIAMLEITDFAKRAGLLHAEKPHLVLTVPHSGPLNSAHAVSIADDLRRAGTRATIIVDHRSKF
jgi:hypothetical protein